MKVSKITIRRRLLLLLLLLVMLFAALVIRLAYVQLGQGAELSAKAEDSWRRNIPFSAKRGKSAIATGLRSPII